MMDNLFWIGFVGAAIAIAFAWLQSRRVMTFSEGSDKMAKIAASIREGANAYLKHQYTTVAKVFLVVFLVLLVMAFATGGEMLSQFTPFAFLTGGIWSMLAGFVGMKIATSSNARTAQAASESLNKGLRVAFSSGSVMGFTVVGLGMLDISIWFVILRFVAGIDDPLTLGNIMVMNGMGASFMAPVSYTHLPADAQRDANFRYFQEVQALYVDMNQKLFHNELEYLSMGMSGDYEDAIRAGATMVRVGSAIFGARHYN